jgi:hypothetical protein
VLCEGDSNSSSSDAPSVEVWDLPNAQLVDLWDSIIIDPTIKSRLLGYCDSSLRFAAANVDPSIISWNRITLLYGPPGTGKTSICRALAQKIFIRHAVKFKSGILLEVDAHSLFSKVRRRYFPMWYGSTAQEASVACSGFLRVAS